MVYRSRAARSFSHDELQDLTRAAQSRNHDEAITGLIVYDDPWFYQWLEGPADSLERIQQSIMRDARHTDIEILRARRVGARVFNDWDMKLVTRAQHNGRWLRDVIYPPLATIAELRRHPNKAPEVLVKLASFPAGREGAVSAADAATQTAAMLKDLIRTQVLPELVVRHCGGLARRPVTVDARVAELAELLLASDSSAALELIHEQAGLALTTTPLYATLLEPAARRLGDLSQDDVCGSLELTIALGRLQTAVRLLGAETLAPLAAAPLGLHSPRLVAPSVLVVPLPGEQHGLGAALDSEAMWQEGWSPQSEFPVDDAALQKILRSNWFDVLDLSVSVALRREHWLPRLAATIDLARRASRNPALIVLVGGRVFAEHAASAVTVGANKANDSASNIVEVIHGVEPDIR
jgi:hypothetical protein